MAASHSRASKVFPFFEWGHPDDRGQPPPGEAGQATPLVDIMGMLSRGGRYLDCLADCEEQLKLKPNPEIEQCRSICIEKISESLEGDGAGVDFLSE